MACDARYPIREVAERTGVNPVTLRAWQRRYGLIKPQRTDSGHRLYSDQDLERIAQILHWLDQGVSIGKVRALLEQSDAPPISPEWQALIERLELAAQTLKVGKLENELRELSRQYPTELFLTHILRPWLQRLAQSARVDRSIIEQFSHQVVIDLLSRFIKSRSGPLIAVLRCGSASPLLSVLARYELQSLKCRSIDLGEVDPALLPLAQERLQATAYLVIFGAGLSASWFDKQRDAWPPNTLASGDIGRVYLDSGWLDLPFNQSLTPLVRQHDAFADLV